MPVERVEKVKQLLVQEVHEPNTHADRLSLL
jgi:hypothetical protein